MRACYAIKFPVREADDDQKRETHNLMSNFMPIYTVRCAVHFLQKNRSSLQEHVKDMSTLVIHTLVLDC